MYENGMVEVELSKCLVDLRFPPVLAASGPFVNDMTTFSNETFGTNGERNKNVVKHSNMFIDLCLTFRGSPIHMVPWCSASAGHGSPKIRGGTIAVIYNVHHKL